MTYSTIVTLFFTFGQIISELYFSHKFIFVHIFGAMKVEPDKYSMG